MATKKPWNQMTTDEKLDALRDDVALAFQQLNGLASNDRQFNSAISEVAAQIQDLRKKVEEA